MRSPDLFILHHLINLRQHNDHLLKKKEPTSKDKNIPTTKNSLKNVKDYLTYYSTLHDTLLFLALR